MTADGKISTFAGTDAEQGFDGDGSPALKAKLADPTSVVLDEFGNVYVVDSGNVRVRKVARDGTISTIAGNGQEGFSGDGGKATNASFRHLRGLAIDSAGNLYVADSDNFLVRKIAVDGTVTSVAGDGHEGDSGDDGPATRAELKEPAGVAIDLSGNLYIGDNGACRIRKVSPDGRISTIAGDGENRFTGDSGPAKAASLCPGALAVDRKGNLYFIDVSSLRVRKIAPDGTITTVAGTGSAGASGDGGPASSARLNVDVDSGLTVDSAGNLYIADSNTNLVRKVFAP